MIRFAIALALCVSTAACLGGMFVKELASTHIIDTGLTTDEYGVIDRGATHHGCTKVDRGTTADNYACPELPAKNPIGCRIEGEKVRCACTGDDGVCKKLIADVVQEGRAP